MYENNGVQIFQALDPFLGSHELGNLFCDNPSASNIQN